MSMRHWALWVAVPCAAFTGTVSAQENGRRESDGTIHVEAFVLPESSFLSAASRRALKEARNAPSVPERSACPPIEEATPDEIAAIRDCRAQPFYASSDYKLMREIYDVDITSDVIGGVPVEIFTPANGVADDNQDRVLINLHSGAYLRGSRTASRMDSIPIAATGGVKVISIDYRLGPEHHFPAASEDVAAVYRTILKTYEPSKVGVYGSSGGAMLAAQSIAWFIKEELPLPAAIGMFGSGAPTELDDERYAWLQSDSARIFDGLLGTNLDGLYGPAHGYFKGVKRVGPLSSPGSYDDVMERFPPTLLMNGGLRDFSLSMVVVTHARLTRLGIEADLHVWEGMPHVFHLNPGFPEAREAYDVVVKFFDEHME